jgi:Cu(I)/Ag(I) efflux system membrane protein CusA/SilA
VRTELGPDATGVGWVFQYALVDDSGTQSLADLRTLQDWNLRYRIQSVPGVAEVASLGGFVKQHQVTVDPNRLKAYGLGITDVTRAVRDSNDEVGGRLLEFAGREYMVRGRGYLKTGRDLESIVLKTDDRGTPVLLRDVASVSLGPEIRRGVSDLDGRGDAVSGIVVMRHGENAREVIRRVKERLEEIKPSLPKGVRIVTTYDRSELIQHAIDTLTHELLLEMLIVSLVVLVFLWHIPSAIVPIITIPIAVLLAFVPMALLGISSNIMSLAGIAISIGVLVDGAIVEVENAYKKLELWDAGGRKGDFHAVRLEALLEVGPSVFFSLLVIAVAFLPIFTLVDQEGRLFRPLAWTKNLTMLLAAVLAITLDPALRMLFTRMDFVHFRPRWLRWLFNQVTVGRYYPEEKHPISRVLFAVYEPVCRSCCATRGPRSHRRPDRGDHRARLPRPRPRVHAAAQRGRHPLHADDAARDLGDRGQPAAPGAGPGPQVVPRGGARARQGGPCRDLDRPRPLLDDGDDRRPEAAVRMEGEARFYSSWAPGWLKGLVFSRIWPDRISYEELVDEMDRKLQIPGTTNAWTMPIKNRIDMLTTGIRTPIGIKVFGADLVEIERSARGSSRSCARCPARAASMPSAWPAATSWTST